MKKCQQTLHAATDTAYFTLQTRTKTQANRFLVEIPFGHIHKQTIDAIIELTDN